MRLELTASQFHDGHSLHGATKIAVDAGVIVSIEPFTGPVDHALICPGFVDVQMNGFDDVDVSNCSYEDFLRLDRLLLSRGTTSWIATIVTAPLARLTHSIEKLTQWIRQGESGCRGIHVEGPFLGGSPGAHNPNWIIDINHEWISSLPDTVRLVTLAPEQPGAAKAVSLLTSRGVVVSMGHTKASHQAFEECVHAGATMVTHLFNGMSGVHHRDDGVALSALTHSSIVAGLIADGVHVSPLAMALAFQAKSGKGICLVSDSIAWRSEWAISRRIYVENGAPRLEDGTLAGSSTPLAACVKNVIELSSVSATDAIAAATSTPSRVLGFPQTGIVKIGLPADLVCFDDDFHVVEAHRRLVSLRGSQTD